MEPTPGLGSKWGKLSPHLLATLWAVDNAGRPEPDGAQVIAPLTEASIESSANWQSPFEQSGPETRIPTVMALLQSGALQGLSEAILGKPNEQDQGIVSRLQREIRDFAETGQGRSGMTKLNSTQVFTGAPPLSITGTMHFRAHDDPVAEVREPVDQLFRWHLSRRLAPNSSIASAIETFKQGGNFLEALLPSETPTLVALRFDGFTWAPMVLETLSRPLTVPRGKDGDPLHVTVQVKLSTLSAIDRDDYTRARAQQPIKRFNN